MRLLNVLILFPLLFLGACAQPLGSFEMMPKTQTFDALDSSRKFSKSITAGSITAKDKLGGIAPVVSEQYRESVISSLRQAGWYTTPENAKYVLDAQMLEIDQPSFGFSFTVKTTASYLLKGKDSGSVVYKDTLTLPCTKTISDAFNAEVRLRMATGCAVGENTTHFLKVLATR